MERRGLAEALQRRRSRLVGDRGRQLEERGIGGLARPRASGRARAGRRPDRRPPGGNRRRPWPRTPRRWRDPRRPPAGRRPRASPQQQRHLGGAARELGIGRRRRQLIDQRPGGVQIAHGDQPLDARREQAAGARRADGRTGHEQAPGQLAAAAEPAVTTGSSASSAQHHLRIAALPERAIEAAARSALRPMASSSGAASPSTTNSPAGPEGGAGRSARPPARLASRAGRAVPIGRELGCGRRWRLRLGKQPDRSLLRQPRRAVTMIDEAATRPPCRATAPRAGRTIGARPISAGTGRPARPARPALSAAESPR